MDKSNRAMIRNLLSEWGRLVRIDRSKKGLATIDWQEYLDDGHKTVEHDFVMDKVYQWVSLLRVVSPDVYAVLYYVYPCRFKIRNQVTDKTGFSEKKIYSLLEQGEGHLYFYLFGKSEATQVDLDKYLVRVKPEGKINQLPDYVMPKRPTLRMPMKNT